MDALTEINGAKDYSQPEKINVEDDLLELHLRFLRFNPLQSKPGANAGERHS